MIAISSIYGKRLLLVQVDVKADLREMYVVDPRGGRRGGGRGVRRQFGSKCEKAVACLTKDREALLAFFDFPAEHWDHRRTSNPIEIAKLCSSLPPRPQRPGGSKGENQLPTVVRCVKFQNGIER
jgi:hypothetical protein